MNKTAKLIKQLYNWKGRIRPSILKKLGETRDPDAVPALIKALEDKSEPVRIAASEAIKNIPHEQALFPLIQALKDPSRGVRENAAFALGLLGDRRAADPLLETIEQDTLVRSFAVLALAQIGDSRALINHFDSIFPVQRDYCRRQILEKSHRHDNHLFCIQCLHRAVEHSINPGKFLSDDFYACRKCHGNLFLLENITQVVLLLDKNFKEPFTHEGSRVTVNSGNPLCDYNEIHIVDAGDYDVEKLVMKLNNDMDETRKERNPDIPLYLSKDHRLSRSKLNLLNDHFRVIIN